MDELHRAVAQFYPSTSGGMFGGSCTPPEPSGDTAILLQPQTNESQDPTNTSASEGNGRTGRNLIQELKEDRSLELTLRNFLIKQEKIYNIMLDILKEKGVHIEDSNDIRAAIEIWLSDTMELEPASRNRKVGRFLNSLSAQRDKSKYYREILSVINELNGPFVPRS